MPFGPTVRADANDAHLTQRFEGDPEYPFVADGNAYIKGTLGEGVNVEKRQRSVAYWSGNSMNDTGLAYNINGRATVIEANVGERLASFSDPIKAIFGTTVCKDKTVIVTRKYVIGGGVSITPERAPARTVQVKEDVTSVELQRYGGDITMNTNLFLSPGLAKEEMDMKVNAQKRELENKLMELGYQEIFEKGVRLPDAAVRSNPTFRDDFRSTRARDYATLVYNRSCFGCFAKHEFPLANMLATCKTTGAYLAADGPSTLLVLPHGSSEMLRYTKKSSMKYSISGLSTADQKPVNMDISNVAEDPSSGVKIMVHVPPASNQHGAAFPVTSHSCLSEEVTLYTFYDQETLGSGALAVNFSANAPPHRLATDGASSDGIDSGSGSGSGSGHTSLDAEEVVVTGGIDALQQQLNNLSHPTGADAKKKKALEYAINRLKTSDRVTEFVRAKDPAALTELTRALSTLPVGEKSQYLLDFFMVSGAGAGTDVNTGIAELIGEAQTAREATSLRVQSGATLLDDLAAIADYIVGSGTFTSSKQAAAAAAAAALDFIDKLRSITSGGLVYSHECDASLAISTLITPVYNLATTKPGSLAKIVGTDATAQAALKSCISLIKVAAAAAAVAYRDKFVGAGKRRRADGWIPSAQNDKNLPSQGPVEGGAGRFLSQSATAAGLDMTGISALYDDGETSNSVSSTLPYEGVAELAPLDVFDFHQLRNFSVVNKTYSLGSGDVAPNSPGVPLVLEVTQTIASLSNDPAAKRAFQETDGMYAFIKRLTELATPKQRHTIALLVALAIGNTGSSVTNDFAIEADDIASILQADDWGAQKKKISAKHGNDVFETTWYRVIVGVIRAVFGEKVATPQLLRDSEAIAQSIGKLENVDEAKVRESVAASTRDVVTVKDIMDSFDEGMVNISTVVNDTPESTVSSMCCLAIAIQHTWDNPNPVQTHVDPNISATTNINTFSAAAALFGGAAICAVEPGPGIGPNGQKIIDAAKQVPPPNGTDTESNYTNVVYALLQNISFGTKEYQFGNETTPEWLKKAQELCYDIAKSDVATGAADVANYAVESVLGIISYMQRILEASFSALGGWAKGLCTAAMELWKITIAKIRAVGNQSNGYNLGAFATITVGVWALKVGLEKAGVGDSGPARLFWAFVTPILSGIATCLSKVKQGLAFTWDMAKRTVQYLIKQVLKLDMWLLLKGLQTSLFVADAIGLPAVEGALKDIYGSFSGFVRENKYLKKLCDEDDMERLKQRAKTELSNEEDIKFDLNDPKTLRYLKSPIYEGNSAGAMRHLDSHIAHLDHIQTRLKRSQLNQSTTASYMGKSILQDTKKISDTVPANPADETRTCTVRKLVVKMSSAILAKCGSDTGELLVGYPMTSVSTNQRTESMTIALRVYLGAVLKKPEHVTIIPHVAFEGVVSCEFLPDISVTVTDSADDVGIGNAFQTGTMTAKFDFGSDNKGVEATYCEGAVYRRNGALANKYDQIVANTGPLGHLDHFNFVDSVHGLQLYNGGGGMAHDHR